jgi:hypothetical protein
MASCGNRYKESPMLIFVPPTSFEGCGEDSFDWKRLSELLASLIMTVGIGVLLVTLCHALMMLVIDGAMELQSGFGPPPSLKPMLKL